MSAAERAGGGATLQLVRDTMLRDRDLAAIASTGASSVATDLVAGRNRRLDDAIAKIAAAPDPPPVRSGANTAAAGRHRDVVTLKTAADLLKGLTQLRDRTTLLIVVSSASGAPLFESTRVNKARALAMSPSELQLVGAPMGGDVTEQEVVRHLAAVLDLARRGGTTIIALEGGAFRRIR